MDEFAAMSGISRPTLSKYFNDPTSVRSSTRQRIESALADVDYRPNMYAINQNRRMTNNIGIVVPYLADPFFAEIARVMEQHVIDAGFRPVLLGSHGLPSQEIENLDNLRLVKPAGVLLAPLGRTSELDRIADFCADVPTVFFDANIEPLGEAFSGSDNMQSIGLIVDYLCRTGEPPVFFEMKTPSNPNAYKRRNAYVAAMERLGQEPHLVQVEGEGWDFENIGFTGAQAVLSSRGLPSNTLLCSNDRLAIGLLAAAYQLGFRVGQGEGCALRVAGHDDHPFSRYTCPALTTVSQDYSAIATRAAEVLFGIIESGHRPDQKLESHFEGRLIMRGSA
ncbi:DNA-binding transcriptional regulator, LacI/PurR family [Poseidonocella sedimentorum]|uniref:DNA-binding transcriptional regulator, LacI/PurR family n=2 Tax=Poseidonocella sedimentorum TaxID=871652 RepID=A0A1I6EQJ8_9RHOB|nr:DNA-binding transcriptional regulator, LacI/PurR family [Poseidonocella sedimentorum]